MKKAYQKPGVVIENFIPDIAIASVDPIYDAIRQAFLTENGREPNDDSEFQEFIRDYSGLDGNDGWCYFTAYIPS